MLRSSLLFLLCSCSAGELTEAGQHVTFTDTELDVSGCDAVGEVQSDGISVHDVHSRATAVHELRNAAASKGGTHVFVDSEKSPDLTKGIAYKCP
ncbi:MAG TPA: DUF4156 domain-containing protein [Polyangiaceae bacterium]|jgi:hypothetical protein|nr:DUF4156 domain-containing protein [Polyangiaceae bacterium]